MCEELKLIQTHLGIWKLEDWPTSVCSTQLSGTVGIYCIKNQINNKLLIGEGVLGGKDNRPTSHMAGRSANTIWKLDLEKYGQDNFKLVWIIEEEDEIKRKLIENKLQIHFKDNCYNTPRRQYPTQKKLLEYKKLNKLDNYIKVQRDYIDECWETKYCGDKYGQIRLGGQLHKHHILMYILHYGDVCGITSIIHHKCENKKCVNPEHLELCTHSENVRKHYNCEEKLKKINKLRGQGLSTNDISNELDIHKTTVRSYTNFNANSIYKGVHYASKKTYLARILVDNIDVNLGIYAQESHAAQNRDYYIVKNNLWKQRWSILNFHNIDYNHFKPWLTTCGQINSHLLENK
jgi:hypothetical protein